VSEYKYDLGAAWLVFDMRNVDEPYKDGLCVLHRGKNGTGENFYLCLGTEYNENEFYPPDGFILSEAELDKEIERFRAEGQAVQFNICSSMHRLWSGMEKECKDVAFMGSNRS
jgi:hypothetical protein